MALSSAATRCWSRRFASAQVRRPALVSVVTHDVPAGAVAYGVPARVKSRDAFGRSTAAGSMRRSSCWILRVGCSAGLLGIGLLLVGLLRPQPRCRWHRSAVSSCDAPCWPQAVAAPVGRDACSTNLPASSPPCWSSRSSAVILVVGASSALIQRLTARPVAFWWYILMAVVGADPRPVAATRLGGGPPGSRGVAAGPVGAASSPSF